LAGYLRDFASGSADADVYAIDIVWPGILSDYAEDLRPAVGGLPDMLPSLILNDTVKGKLVSVPYFTEVSLLYYRTDLLQKHHFTRPPRTWSELEHQSRTIQDGERANGNNLFWGFLWQGAASEALSCNALEWQISQGGGRLIGADGKPSIRRDRFVAALERARGWIGTLSPPGVTSQLEDDSLQIWKSGEAAFMRNWPYAYRESMKDDSSIRNRVGVTVLPRGDGLDGRHADILGGFQLKVSKTSKNKSAAIEMVKFLTSPEIQRVNATTRGYAPTRPSLYYDSAVLKANPFFGTLRDVLLEGAVTRPSTVAGSRYDEISKAYFTAVRQTLTGQKGAAPAVQELEKELQTLVSR
jgi:trehalose/maltose transport system substrate-binding protein